MTETHSQASGARGEKEMIKVELGISKREISLCRRGRRIRIRRNGIRQKILLLVSFNFDLSLVFSHSVAPV